VLSEDNRFIQSSAVVETYEQKISQDYSRGHLAGVDSVSRVHVKKNYGTTTKKGRSERMNNRCPTIEERLRVIEERLRIEGDGYSLQLHPANTFKEMESTIEQLRFLFTKCLPRDFILTINTIVNSNGTYSANMGLRFPLTGRKE